MTREPYDIRDLAIVETDEGRALLEAAGWRVVGSGTINDAPKVRRVLFLAGPETLGGEHERMGLC